MDEAVGRASGGRRLAVGWFSFTCCEDSTILLTELLNDHLDEWKEVIEFRHIRALKTRNSLSDLDVAFVEGAISSETQAEEARRIRANARYVVAIGACACSGKPSTSRNRLVDELLDEKIRWYLDHFDYDATVRPLGEVVEVDDMVRGCPMKVPSFLQTLEAYLRLFEVGRHA